MHDQTETICRNEQRKINRNPSPKELLEDIVEIHVQEWMASQDAPAKSPEIGVDQFAQGDVPPRVIPQFNRESHFFQPWAFPGA